MDIEQVFPHPVLIIHVQDVVLQTWIVMAILIPLAYVMGRNLQIRPRPWQHLVEAGFEFIDGLIRQQARRQVHGLFELLATLMLYVAAANLLGLIPVLRAPTRSLNTTIALAIISFLSVQYFGIRERGLWRYSRSFVEPIGCLLPLNILGQLSRTMAMALRLFGNVIASEVVGEVIFRLLPLLGPIPFNLLGVITGVIQALVFTYLTVVFIGNAIGKREKEQAPPPEHE